MNEKKQVTTIWCLVLLIIILIVIVGVLIVNVLKGRKEANLEMAQQLEEMKREINTIKEQANNEISEGNKTNSTVNKEELVTTAYHKVYTVFDEEITVNIPQINLDFENVKKINKEINEKKEELDKNPYNTDYKCYLNNNVLSLVIIQDTETDTILYTIYNIDVSNGKSITNDEIIKEKGKTKSEYETEIAKIAENTFKSRFSDLYNYDGTLLTKTLDYWTIDTPIFLDEDNTINIIAKYYTEIGSGYVIDIVDTQI